MSALFYSVVIKKKRGKQIILSFGPSMGIIQSLVALTWDKVFGKKEKRILMVGLDNAGSNFSSYFKKSFSFKKFM